MTVKSAKQLQFKSRLEFETAANIHRILIVCERLYCVCLLFDCFVIAFIRCDVCVEAKAALVLSCECNSLPL
jgi:hypothetical protein